MPKYKKENQNLTKLQFDFCVSPYYHFVRIESLSHRRRRLEQIEPSPLRLAVFRLTLPACIKGTR